MDRTRESYSANRPLSMKKNHKDCRTETRDFLKELWSWKEESNRKFFNIINSHRHNIDNGIRDLVEEVSGLQGELSDIKQEKNVLQETVDELHGEIRQLNGKLQALSEPGHYLNMDNDTEGNDISGKEFLYTAEYDIERPEMSSGYYDQEISIGYAAVSDEAMKKQSKNQFNDSGLLIEGVDNVEKDLLDE